MAIETLLKPLFEVSEKETAFDEGDKQAQQRLATVIRLVTKGCQITLQHSRFDALVSRLDAVDVELRGYAYEGAGVGLAALDSVFPWKNRLGDFMAGPGATYIYAVPLGAGMGLARLRRKPEPFLKRLDPVMGWLIVDGYGFHEGFFSRRKTIEKQRVPAHLSAYGRRVFDHGVGRSIWFTSSTRVERVAETIATFSVERQADLWSGVGLACGYTGGVAREAIENLCKLVGPYRAQLAVGVAIAADARHTVGNPSQYVEQACEVICGVSSKVAAQMVQEARKNLPTDGIEPAYEIWRQRLAAQFMEITGDMYQREEAI